MYGSDTFQDFKMVSKTKVSRRKCPCGRLLAPHANGTIPRHTYLVKDGLRVRCLHVGELVPTIARERGKNVAETASAGRNRGGRRAAKRDTKNTYKRNSAGGYNGRPGSAGTRGK
jgi:hypothetical protein